MLAEATLDTHSYGKGHLRINRSMFCQFREEKRYTRIRIFWWTLNIENTWNILTVFIFSFHHDCNICYHFSTVIYVIVYVYIYIFCNVL